jgi:predicted nucleic acid-binding protein
VKRFVLDASVALAWFVDRPTAPYADHIRELLLRGSRAIVPTLWHMEMANGFIVAERRGVLTPSDILEALENLEEVILRAIENSRDSVSMRRALNASRKFGLTAYDAVYLETALGQGVPLATLDRQLKAAASKAGVEVLQ